MNYVKCDVQHDLTETQVNKFANSVPPIPLPILSEKQYLDMLEALSGEEAEITHLVEPDDSAEEEFNILRPDGKFIKRETKFYPVNAVGKLMTSSGSGSGAMIGPNLILTAGHCVHPGGTGNAGDVYKNIHFQPSHPDHGIWYKVKDVYVTRVWVAQKLYQMDLAICVTEQVMGIKDFWGIQTVIGESKYGWTNYGYPAEGQFDGVYPYTDGGPYTFKPWEDGSLKFNLMAFDHNDLTAGCSGGPWITNGRISQGNFIIQGKDTMSGRPFHINGINSFEFARYPGIIVSPYFGGDAEVFFKEVLAAVTPRVQATEEA